MQTPTKTWEQKTLELAKYKVESFKDPVTKAVKGGKLKYDKGVGCVTLG